MTTARDIMHPGVECVGENQTLMDAARMMRDLDVGAVPVCGEDDRLHGIITDRDIVIRCCAEGRDPAQITAGQAVEGQLYSVDAADDADTVVGLMARHQIRRVPVLENKRLVGMISEADLARNLSEDKIAEFVSSVSRPTEAPHV
ncbi:hypoxic response protein 1 [Actinomadura sp. NBRC 104412]|uniref:CBS domain-containing protein n=1 Tax=Actinomadura sp. NBRC 104412 TaxID=3032203 RepID=UPI0024A3A559|nr:CBS domain-containing protein [Actinomadura sp. NBRC 104412]GLZ08014.1 hypoxic response protein 1 [Actinomadura sp. NBRC 104412]